MPFLQNAGQKVNFLFALAAALYLTLLTVDFVRYGGVVAPSWITAAFTIALGGWGGCRRSEKPRAPRIFAVLAAVSAAAQIALCCAAVPAYPVSAARKRIRAQGLWIHAVRRRRGTHIFRPRFRRIFHIGAVKTGHPTKTRMPGFFFMPVTAGAPPVPDPAWRDTRATPARPRTMSPAPAQSARRASAANPPAPAPSAGSMPAGSMR